MAYSPLFSPSFPIPDCQMYSPYHSRPLSHQLNHHHLPQSHILTLSRTRFFILSRKSRLLNPFTGLPHYMVSFWHSEYARTKHLGSVAVSLRLSLCYTAIVSLHQYYLLVLRHMYIYIFIYVYKMSHNCASAHWKVEQTGMSEKVLMCPIMKELLID